MRATTGLWVMGLLLVGCDATDPVPAIVDALEPAADEADRGSRYGWGFVDQVVGTRIVAVAAHDDGLSAHASTDQITCLWATDHVPLGGPVVDGGQFDEDEDVEEGAEGATDGATTDFGGTTALSSDDGLTLLVEDGVSSGHVPRGEYETSGAPNSWAIARFDGVGTGGTFLDDGRFVDWLPTDDDGAALRVVDTETLTDAVVLDAPFRGVEDTVDAGDGVLYVSAEGETWRVDLHTGDVAALGVHSRMLAWNGALVVGHDEGIDVLRPDGTIEWSAAIELVLDVVTMSSGELVVATPLTVERWDDGVQTGRARFGRVHAIDAAADAERVFVGSRTGLTVLEPKAD